MNYKDFTVVVPALNEGDSIKQTIRAIKKAVSGAKIIVVDDGSTDGTGKKAAGERVKVITHNPNKGYMASLVNGMDSAKTKFVGFLDADMTYNPDYFPTMLKLLEGKNLDCVWGNRFGGKFNRMPFIRKFGNLVITTIFFLVTGKNIHDCASGQRVFRKDSLKKLDIKTLPVGLDGITALSKRIVKRKLKYKVIPINYEDREGSSKLSVMNHGYKMIMNVLRER